MIANDGIIILQLLTHSILLVWIAIGMGQIIRFLNKTGWKEGEMDTKYTGTFDEWWTNQCLKMATGNKIYLARSVYPGDQKVAFMAGRDTVTHHEDAMKEMTRLAKEVLRMREEVAIERTRAEVAEADRDRAETCLRRLRDDHTAPPLHQSAWDFIDAALRGKP